MALSCGTQDLHCGMWDLSLQHADSVAAVRRLLSSCGVRSPERVGSVVVAHELSCPAACGILVPCVGRRILNHWTTRENVKFSPAEPLGSMQAPVDICPKQS